MDAYTSVLGEYSEVTNHHPTETVVAGRVVTIDVCFMLPMSFIYFIYIYYIAVFNAKGWQICRCAFTYFPRHPTTL